MKMMENIAVWGEHEEKTLAQIRTCARTADKAALIADGHLGYAVPIGGVVAYKDAISPSGVGFDIACGNKAVRLDMPGAELRAKIGTIMDDVWSTLSFGVGRKNAERVEHAIFERDYPGWDLEATSTLNRPWRPFHENRPTIPSARHLDGRRACEWIEYLGDRDVLETHNDQKSGGFTVTAHRPWTAFTLSP